MNSTDDQITKVSHTDVRKNSGNTFFIEYSVERVLFLFEEDHDHWVNKRLKVDHEDRSCSSIQLSTTHNQCAAVNTTSNSRVIENRLHRMNAVTTQRWQTGMIIPKR